MSPESQDPIVALQRLVSEMGIALAVSERHTRRLERGLRWAVLGAVAAVILAAGMAFRPFGNAVAQAAMPPSKSVEEALDRINQNLMPLGMMGQMMQAGVMAAIREAQAAQKDPSIQSPLSRYTRQYAAEYLKVNHIAPDQATPQLMEQIYQQAIMEATGGLLVDAGVLLARLRQDSDYFRRFLDRIGGPEEVLIGIQDELHHLNLALASVPVMAANMTAMAQQMGVMTYSVGSTMGKAGSWMPW
jgi:hypothetical protein